MIIRSILTSIAGLILITSAAAQNEWEILHYGDIAMPHSIDFIDADTGWIARGTELFRTFDGGANWELLIADKYFQEIEFSNGSTGWSIGLYSELLKTLDGGLNWDTVLVSDSSLNHILAINDTVAIASGNNNILRTVNGGISWSDITPKRFSELGGWGSPCFLNMDTGIVVEDADTANILFSTFDGGKTWGTMDLPDSSHITLLKYVSPESILFTARRNFDGKNLLLEATDHFQTWSVLFESDYDVNFFYLDEGLMFAVVDSGLNRLPGSADHILKSTDGGETWKATKHPPLNYSEYQIYSTSRGITLMADRSFWTVINLELESKDMGDHWAIKKWNLPVHDVHFIDQKMGYMVAGFSDIHFTWGALLSTEDGGYSWNIRSDLNGSAVELCFANESRGFISVTDVSDWNGNYITSDGWDHFEYEFLSANNIHGMQGLFFINDSTGWAINQYGGNVLSKTTDAGITWEPQYTREDNEWYLNSIFFLNEDKGFAVGSDGLLIEFSGEDFLEVLPSGTTLPLDQVLFISDSIGIITGGYGDWEGDHGSIMLRTTDGGDHWAEVPDMPYLIKDVCFSDSLNGVAVGEAFKGGKGVILETADAGESWEVFADTLPERIRALDFVDGIWWAIGDNSLILRKASPALPKIKTKISSFMVVGDLHHYSPSPDFSTSLLHEFAMEAIEEEVDFVFFPGDLIIRGSGDPGVLDSLLRDWRFILDTLDQHNIRLFACRGNNDIFSGPAWDSLFSGIYQFPLNGPDEEKNLTYAIEFDNLLFVAMDEYTDPHKVNQVWLDEILKGADQQHIFVAGHEPAFRIYKSDILAANPENRNQFWESLTNAGADAYFCGHAHFYDHTWIDDGDGDPDNDVHQVIVGTGGGYLHPDAAYDGDNGSWMPQRQFHEETNGYVLVELEGDEALMTWKHRTGPGIFEYGGDSCTFKYQADSTVGIDPQEISFQPGQRLMIYPNPFHSNTTIQFQVSDEKHLELSIYDMLGRKVTTLLSESLPPGIYQVDWNAEGFDSGLYICRLKTGNGRYEHRMIILH